MCVLTALSSSHSVSLPLLGPPCSLRQNNLGMRPVDNPAVASQHASERKSLTLLTLSQRLERIRLSEEGISEAELGQKRGLLCQLFKV